MKIKLVGREKTEQVPLTLIQILNIELIGLAGNHLFV